MPMEMGFDREDTKVTCSVSGRVDGTNAREFQDSLINAIQDTDREVVLDFAELSYISSAGLRAILLAAKTLSKQSASLEVASLTPSIREVFETSGFDKIIKVRS